MATLYLVRHGQASLAAHDYDVLSPLGARQCERLGAWWRGHGMRFDSVLGGTLRRHRESLAAIAAGLGAPLQARVEPALDEYDSAAVLRAIAPERTFAPPATPEAARAHFRLLREGLLAWMAGRTQPAGMPTHAAFVAGIVTLLDALRGAPSNANLLAVSSGGPIATALGHVLGLAPPAVVELNLQLRNSAVCELRVAPKRLTLVSFNVLTHLDAQADWITHA